MSSYRYILEPYTGRNSRHTCPSCKKVNQFTRYVDIQTGNYIANNVGICNRSNKCGFHYPPKSYFIDNCVEPSSTNLQSNNLPIIVTDKSKQDPDYIDYNLMVRSMKTSSKNNLVTYLNTIFDSGKVKHLINLYHIGTSLRYNGGSTVFWQVDTQDRVRTGKIIKYDSTTGKRIKKPYVATNWVHRIIHPDGFNLKQCLFGEHLLNADSSMPIAIVESEKTAIIAMAKLPEYLWMATGSMNEFKSSKLNVLKGRRVVAFPDLGAYDYWFKKASALDFQIEVSDYLEKNATAKQQKEGLDIGDFL